MISHGGPPLLLVPAAIEAAAASGQSGSELRRLIYYLDKQEDQEG